MASSFESQHTLKESQTFISIKITLLCLIARKASPEEMTDSFYRGQIRGLKDKVERLMI